MCLPAIAYFVIFHYIPIYGNLIAFKDFSAYKGIMRSPWVGLENFERFFESFMFFTVIKNTILLSVYQIAVGFPITLALAVLLNRMVNLKYKSLVQTVTYAPHFISMVVMVGMLQLWLSPRHGFVNTFIGFFGADPIFFLGSAKLFRSVYVLSGVWQNFGWGMIIYLAALSSVDPQLYDASYIDGATKLQQIFYVDIPSIMPTVVIVLILRLGRIMNVGFQKAFLMQNPLNLEASEIISTYVYKAGLLQAEFSYGAAIGLFNTIINFVLLITVNNAARKLTEQSLW